MNNSATKTMIQNQISFTTVSTTNKSRINKLNSTLSNINKDYVLSCDALNEGSQAINDLVKSNRGGNKGAHGFIGEFAQVYLSNSISLVRGDIPHYTLLNDNGPIDYLYDNIMIQQKACRSGGCLGLDRAKSHSTKYPFFVPSGGIYHIPKDFFEKYTTMLNTPKETANKFLKEDYRLWNNLNTFNNENPEMKFSPMNFSYDDIQVNSINDTIQRVKEENREVYKLRRKEAFSNHRPTYKECCKVSAISAFYEGSLDGGLELYNKLINKNISEFGKDDTKDIAKSTINGAKNGAIKSAAVYCITNSTHISAPVASAAVTASIELAKETKDAATGKISKMEYAENSAWICADATVSVVATTIGTKCLPKLLPTKYKAIGEIAGPLISNLIIGTVYNKAKASIINRNTKEAQVNEQ